MEFTPACYEVLQPSAPKERMTALEKKCAIRMENITKRFGSKVIANKNVNLDLYEGEILSLLGENGSGKTTLMNMLSGIYRPDAGHIRVNGKEVHIKNTRDAINHGIAMVNEDRRTYSSSFSATCQSAQYRLRIFVFLYYVSTMKYLPSMLY